MTRTAAALASLLAALLVACATPAQPAAISDTSAPVPSSIQDHSMPSSLEAHALPGARAAADHLLAFLSTLENTTALKPALLGQAFGVQLGPDTTNGAGWTVYHSPDLGQGWTWWVQQSDARPSMKNGFRFWFDHPDRTADATPVCALSLDRLRGTLTQHGWVERPVPSEIGSILAVEFSKNDVVLTLTPRDGTDVEGTACVLAVQTTDGH
jgi:hypothetical protein